MNLIHIIYSEAAAKNLNEAILLDETLQGDVIVLNDNLAFGDIYTQPNESFTMVRNRYHQIVIAENEPLNSDEAKIETILKNTTPDTKVWFWMAPNVCDTMVYYWLLQYFQKYPNLLHVININALPFFNDKGQLYYPTNFSLILPKELIKCKRLAKEVSPADYEVDVDEWKRIAGENAKVRAYDGNKKIVSKNETNFDILIYTACTAEPQKAQRVINSILNKNSHLVTESFLISRIKTLIEQGKIGYTGDLTKTLRDFEIKKIDAASELNEAIVVA